MADARIQALEHQVQQLVTAVQAANLQADAVVNLTPDQQAVREHLLHLCTQFCGVGPPPAISSLQINDHTAIPRCDSNPVPAPPHLQQWGSFFDVGSTAEGQRIRSALGAGSGYYQEYRTWAPWVSHLTDLAAHLLRITAHPTLPADSRQLLGPVAAGLEHLACHVIGALDVH